ncbi:MAG: hypothetical protein KDE09_13285 [Anaerolineales bacterium]|nr:hypothetical protein [Anaerolineales bacterium]
MKISVFTKRILPLNIGIALIIALLLVYMGLGHSQLAIASGSTQPVQLVVGRISPNNSAPISGTIGVYLPIIGVRWSPIPQSPSLNSISNSDLDNLYNVSWSQVASAQQYILEEAKNPSFSQATVVYQGSNLSWSVSGRGKTPATYYYRVRARNEWGTSFWSTIKSITIHPLFIGLDLRWDGRGYIRGSNNYDVGWHEERSLDILTDVDTARSNNHSWYDPNPQGWSSSNWYSYYSVSTGIFRGTSSVPDPSWKWSYDWILAYDLQFTSGQIVQIDGQPFRVSGPHSGYTAFGKFVQYWELTNTNRFLYWSNGSDWKQYVLEGAAKLQYDAGSTRLLIHDDILRTYYYQDSRTSDTVQYISNLTAADSFPASIGTDLFLESDQIPYIGTSPGNLGSPVDTR